MTTAQCGVGHCIEGRCGVVTNGRLMTSAPTTHRGMFGDGHGYGGQILAADLAALAAAGSIVGIDYVADSSIGHSNWGGYPLAMAPPVLTGPIVHLAHRRPLAALFSFIGWSSVAGTSFFVGVTYGSATLSQQLPDQFGHFDSPGIRGIPVGLAVAAGGGVLMTTLDAWMARSVEPSQHARAIDAATPGHRAMFADDRGYSLPVLVADLAAVAVTPLLMEAAYSADHQTQENWGWQLLGTIPPALTGPAFHAAHRRWLPAIISFLGWNSVIWSSVSLGALFAITPAEACFGCVGGGDNSNRGWTIGISIAGGGAALMTALDVYMARTPRTRPPSTNRDDHGVQWLPYAAPTIGGGTLGVSGRF